MQCVGATTLNEYRKYIEKDAALERRFQQVKVEAPSVEETILILKGLRVEVRGSTTRRSSPTRRSKRAAKLSDRYLTGRFLPDKAIDVMDEAGARARIGAMTRPPDVKDIEHEIEEIRTPKGSGDQGAGLRESRRAARYREAGQGEARAHPHRMARAARRARSGRHRRRHHARGLEVDRRAAQAHGAGGNARSSCAWRTISAAKSSARTKR